MRKNTKLGIGLIGLGLVFVLVSGLLASDKVNYQNSRSFVKSREVSDQVSSFEVSTSTTNMIISFQRVAHQVAIYNTDAANDIFVNLHGTIAYNVDSNDMTTLINHNKCSSGATNFETIGVQVGDFIVLDEADDNDGVYYIIAVDGKELTLNSNLAVTNVADQDFIVRSNRIESQEGWVTFDVGTQSFGIISASGTPAIRVRVSYQKGS